MVFRLTDEQEAIRRSVREFGANEIEPVAAEYNREHRYPRDLIREAAQYDLLAPTTAVEYGGAGLGAVSWALITEELWHADPGIGLAINSVGFGADIIEEFGDEWMKEAWLPKITGGEAVCAGAISEPAHGSDVASIETEAEKDGDEWVIDGTKMWITNATVADVMVLLAKTEPGDGHDGISSFLVPADTDGLSTEPIDNKLGVNASDLGEVILDGVRVPEENLIGEEGRGFYHLMEFFTEGRVMVAGQAIGAAQAALDDAIQYAGEREQFGQPIGDFQAIQHKLAEMATQVEAARSLAYRAGQYVDDGDEAAATRLASMAKLFASEMAVDVTDEAIQVHGGAGYVSDFDVERYYRDARITKIYEGTSEIQKNVIADELL
ncbi:acyl-CoA dehydrogenase family protein [Halobacteriales archaeon Cl-PHB]